MNRFYRTFESKRVSEICKFEDIRDISKSPHCETFLSRRIFFYCPASTMQTLYIAMRVLYITVLVFQKSCLINTLSFYQVSVTTIVNDTLLQFFFIYNSPVSSDYPKFTGNKDFWHVLKDCVDFVKPKTISEFLNHWLFTAKFVQEP